MKRTGHDDDRFLTGEPGEAGIPAFTHAVRGTYGDAPSELTARAHLAAMTEAAREAVHIAPEEATPMRQMLRTRSLRYAAIAVAAMFALMSVGTGLAFAGVVTLPEPVRGVLHVVGINVPDDDADEAAEAEADAAEEAAEAEADAAEEAADEAEEADETDAPEADETDAPDADDTPEADSDSSDSSDPSDEDSSDSDDN